MARSNMTFVQFSAGQLGEDVQERTDLNRYKVGLSLLKNRLPLLSGGTVSRPPLKFITEVKAEKSGQSHALLPYTYDQNNRYMILMGEQYFWFFKDEARIGTVELAVPYLASEVKDVRACTFGRLLFLVHGKWPVKVLTRTSDSSWAIGDMAAFDGPYLTATKGATLSLSGASGTVTATSSVGNIFAATDTTGSGGTGRFNRHIRIKDGTTWRWAKITGFSSSSVVTIAIQPDPLGVAGVFVNTTNLEFRLGAWSSTTGFPRTISSYENRVVLGGSDNYPDKLWFSEIDDYVSYRPTFPDGTTGASLAVDLTLSHPKVNDICWMMSKNKLLVGTTAAEHVIALSSGVDGQAAEARCNANEGSPFVDAITAGDGNLFFSANGTRIKEFSFNFDVDAFVPSDLSLLSEKLLKTGVKQRAWHKHPWLTLWLGMNDGSLVSFTYNKGQEFFAYATHEIGGGGKVNSIEVVDKGFNDKLYLVVDRVIDGSTRSYVEIMDDKFEGTKMDAVFLDSYKEFYGTTPAATLTLSALSGNVTVTSSSSVFSASDVGKVISVRDPFKRLIAAAEITGYTSGTVVAVTVTKAFLSLSVASGWQLSRQGTLSASHLTGLPKTIKANGGVLAKEVQFDGGGQYQIDQRYFYIYTGLPYVQEQNSLKLFDPELKTGLVKKERVTDFGVVVKDSSSFDATVNESVYRPIAGRPPADLMDEGQELVSGLIQSQITSANNVYTNVKIKQDLPFPLTVLSWGVVYDVSQETR